MIQDRRHDGAELFIRQGADQVQDRRGRDLLFDPHQQPAFRFLPPFDIPEHALAISGEKQLNTSCAECGA